MAVCDGIHAFAGRCPSLSPAATTLALDRLNAISRNARLPGPLIDSAMLATAVLGSDGFDQLMNLKLDATSPNQIRNVLYTALAETDDPRAVAVLLEASISSDTENRRIQAIRGLGQVFSRAGIIGRPIADADRATCIASMKRLLDEVTPDAIFGAALKALGHMTTTGQDPELEQTTMTALSSLSEARREAALEMLFQQDGLLASTISSRVHELAGSDGDPNVRCAAAAVMDKQEALASATSGDGQ
jgi:HEAT repeat protein